MNANELAEIIEHLENARYIGASKASEMLRQQQAEIEALKQIIDANNLNQNIGQLVKPTNEPVAWMIKTLDGRSLMLYGEEQPPKFKEDVQYIPLYTHPVKELTDAITLLEKYADKLEDERPNKGLSDVVLECVEILRKAQEK
jgi:hypothetical protein